MCQAPELKFHSREKEEVARRSQIMATRDGGPRNLHMVFGLWVSVVDITLVDILKSRALGVFTKTHHPNVNLCLPTVTQLKSVKS